jgi:ABC-type molybdate transport system substrate-binding protein
LNRMAVTRIAASAVNVPSLVCAGVIAAMATVNAQPAARLTVCHAGSLLAAFVQLEHAFTAQHPDVAVTDVSGGSVSLVRRLASGSEACDVYASADYLNIDQLLKPAKLADYTVVFARGRMVLAYLATDPKARSLPRRPSSAPATTHTCRSRREHSSPRTRLETNPAGGDRRQTAELAGFSAIRLRDI